MLNYNIFCGEFLLFSLRTAGAFFQKRVVTTIDKLRILALDQGKHPERTLFRKISDFVGYVSGFTITVLYGNDKYYKKTHIRP